MSLHNTRTLPFVRTSSVLTTSEVLSEVREAKELIKACNQASFFINFTKGSLDNAEVKLYVKQEGGDWHAIPEVSYSGGVGTVSPITLTLTASTKFVFETPINTEYLAVGVKGTGTVTDSLMEIGLNLSVS